MTLTCSALGGPNNTFSWQREGVSINVTEDTLVISSITTSEGGDHTCIVSNTAGQGSAIVTMFIRPIITSAEDILTTNGTDIEFVCEADGIPSPIVTWERVGDAGNTTVSENTNFALSPAVFGSEGDYQCVAVSTTGRATQTATLTSTFKTLHTTHYEKWTNFLCSSLVSPEGSVVASPRDVSSERGLEQTFTCDASGGPGNTFLWTRLLDSVVVSRTSQLNVVVNNSYNGGEYRCTVQNDAGNDTDTVVLRGTMCVCVFVWDFTANVCIPTPSPSVGSSHNIVPLGFTSLFVCGSVFEFLHRLSLSCVQLLCLLTSTRRVATSALPTISPSSVRLQPTLSPT